MIDESKDPNWVFNVFDDSAGIARKLADGIHTRIFPGNNSMLSIVRIDPFTKGTIHQHPEEQWGVLLQGECVRIQEGEEIHVKAGDFWHTPANVSHGVRTEGRGAIILDIFSPPRPEYRSGGSGFGNVGDD